MLTAKNKINNEIVNLIEGFNGNPKEIDWVCKICDSKLIYVKESYLGRIAHFRHKEGLGHDFEPETEEHLNMKKVIYGLIKKDNKIEFIDLEHNLGYAIPDIFVKLKCGIKIAVECQCSKLSEQKIYDRTLRYNVNDVYVLWVLGLNNENFVNLNKVLNQKRVYVNSYRICKIEKWLHWHYFGRVYYFDGFKVVPVHFGKTDKKTYKTINISNNLMGYGLCGIECGDTKIARFFDRKFWESKKFN